MKFSNYKIVPKTEIGQHFLTNNKVLELVVKQIPLKSKVLEIGAGPGQLTEKLAESVKCVEAVEIDRQFLPLLEAIKKKQSQVNIIIGDALDLDFKKYADFWIAGNLPYHITEPLLAKIINLPIKGAVFLVDDFVDSRWTLTIVTALLRQGGSGQVFPLALALNSLSQSS